MVGTSRRHLIRLEQDVHSPRPEMLARIAEATGVSVDELCGPSEDDEEAAKPVTLDEFLRRRVRELYIEATNGAAPPTQVSPVHDNEPSGSHQEASLGSST